LADAKARLSELVDLAIHDGPQTITRNGKAAAVVVSADEWTRRIRPRGNLAEFFAASPLRDSGVDVQRAGDLPRDMNL
jgi:prevent-host-death family protein